MLKVVMARGRKLKKGGGDLEVQKQNVATTRNLAFCNCFMQLVSSCMRHMQLEIRPVTNDKLHEICSCMRQSYYISTYG